MFSSLILPLLLAASSTSSTPVTTSAVSTSTHSDGVEAARPLKGRFIHITDVHPDPFYRTGASEDEACHFEEKRKKKKGKGKKAKGKATNAEGWAVDGEVNLNDEDDVDAPVKPDGARDAGYWGLPVSDCDTPLSLVNAAFDWLAEQFKGEVDFVVWTGDNARHDIDSRLPRSLPEIFDLNRFVVDRVRQAFGKDVPIVASIGNNDIYPHNVLAPGPNKITSEYLSIWHSFIPEHFLHTFARGGYYSVEAIKGDLLLVSLNTLYFYSRNSIVDGCPPFVEDSVPWRTDGSANASSRAYLDPSLHPSSPAAASLFQSYISSLTSPSSPTYSTRAIDPGTEQLLWLEQQLTLARARGMQVWLTGHVPATRENWYEGCYQRYTELVLAWQDTVVGQLFGHMNVDFFSFLQDSDTSQPSSSSSSPAPNDLRSLSSSLLSSTYTLYSSLPSEHETRERDFAPVYVSPSVIPTYLPGVRVWEYNVTGGGGEGNGKGKEEMWRMVREEQDVDPLMEEAEEESWMDRVCAWAARKKGRRGGKGKGQKKRPGNPDRPPRPPRHSSPHAPARKNTYLTPLSYTQYYLSTEAIDEANVAAAQGDKKSEDQTEPQPPRWQLMYTTLSTTELARRLSRQCSSTDARDPIFPSTLLPPPIRSLLSTPSTPSRTHRLRRMLHSLNLTPYDGVLSSDEGLTVKALLRVARWVTSDGGKKKGGKRWEAFRWRMGVGSGEL